MIRLRFNRGTILIEGNHPTPYGHWDDRVGAYRAEAIFYGEILDYLTRRKFQFQDEVPNLVSVTIDQSSIKLKDYQESALNAWEDAGRRGVIELPTGSGKSYIALKAIERCNVPTLIVVPTLDLMEQWKTMIGDLLKVKAGTVGGGTTDIQGITVITYDSAYLRAETLGNRFLFLVFDEVHHLPAPSYMQIAEMYIAPMRMGLTATYRRDDGSHLELPRLVGGVVFRLKTDALVGEHLAPFIHDRIYVDLTDEERQEYDENYSTFKHVLKKKRIRLGGLDGFQRFIMRSGWDPEVRQALLARNRAIEIALNSEAKLTVLGELLRTYTDEKILIFTLHNSLVYRISRRFLIPAITHQSPKEERKEILDAFRTGEYRTVVTSQVLDEGIDVPDASVAIIISGTGSTREYIQRLGRILRKQSGKTAKIFEIVARDTLETSMSQKRHR
ncbi:MAG: DEAD/DEAH box helicase family protein [Candidatus Thorarchaeota archaeon]|nr:DEAD/DEAH box helicase family protein [Candidatus Thorarchaeota archaeon]